MFRRIIACFIDLLFISIPFYIYFQLFKHKNSNGEFVMKGVQVFPFLWITYSLYFIIQEYKWQGTIGKRILRLKIAKTDNSVLTLTDVLKRHLLDIIELFVIPFIAIIVVATNDKGQRVGDLLAKTQVTDSSSDH